MKKKTRAKNKEQLEGHGIFEEIEGLKSVSAEDVREFEAAMNDQVIPEVVKVVEKRRMLAAETRHRQLKV